MSDSPRNLAREAGGFWNEERPSRFDRVWLRPEEKRRRDAIIRIAKEHFARRAGLYGSCAGPQKPNIPAEGSADQP